MDNVSKEFVNAGLDEILFGIKLKDIDTVIDELHQLKDDISSYREPYKCSTCRVSRCEVKRLGCRDCSGWK